MHTFKKEERLCNKKLITQLYHSGSSFLCYPYKVSWMITPVPGQYPAMVLFAVSKKRYRHSVQRNLIKRRSREAYRTHKQQLYNCITQAGKTLVFSVNYIGNDIADFSFIEKKMIKALGMLCTEVSK